VLPCILAVEIKLKKKKKKRKRKGREGIPIHRAADLRTGKPRFTRECRQWT